MVSLMPVTVPLIQINWNNAPFLIIAKRRMANKLDKYFTGWHSMIIHMIENSNHFIELIYYFPLFLKKLYFKKQTTNENEEKQTKDFMVLRSF